MEICGALSCSRDQEQARPDGDGSEGARGALSRRCETFDGIGSSLHCIYCIASAALHRPFSLYFSHILYANTANNNSTETKKKFALMTFCAAAAGLIQT
jgi:hypothetical protein